MNNVSITQAKTSTILGKGASEQPIPFTMLLMLCQHGIEKVSLERWNSPASACLYAVSSRTGANWDEQVQSCTAHQLAMRMKQTSSSNFERSLLRATLQVPQDLEPAVDQAAVISAQMAKQQDSQTSTTTTKYQHQHPSVCMMQLMPH